ncbi:MAG: acyl carrier protein [Alphaproteobacteria bacterium]|nr:acyl carrier protein [Alphaproteobacteria bacterium]MBP7759936.1 acyl carrier protein [Alphaproteobacteria bacterium]MBP7763290.1 acyl carrier protein [Alphaproteobacteria bacterium]MBP7904898.1 acyl carrier protein [Alphaproteobacteria bacterium]
MSDALLNLFAEVLEVDIGKLNDNTSPDNTSQWDSLAAMGLVVAIEEKFGVQLSTKEIMKMTTIGLARETLRGKGVVV